MKNLIIALAIVSTVISAGTAVKADGFACQTVDGELNVKVYNHTQPEEGTRTAAVMILSDASVGAGNKTIAVFRDSSGTLDSKGVSYLADVDLRFKDSARKGEYILGTRLGELDTLKLTVAFSYADPVQAGEVVRGSLKAVKRNGTVIRAQVECERYLKN